jgi:hypothetical protein
MSYDLYFWREVPDQDIDIDRFSRELDDCMEFPGIVPVPVAEIKAAFREKFPDIQDLGATLDWEGAGSYFQVGFTFLDTRTVTRTSVFCGYELLKSPASLELLRQVAQSIGCRIYDPQQE